MGLRMKNYNIFEVHWNIRLLGEGSWKANIEGEDCLKRGIGQFADLRGDWQERGGGIFDGVGDAAMHTMGVTSLPNFQSLV